MAKLRGTRLRGWRRSKWFFPTLAGIVVFVLIAVIVPLAVILKQSSEKPTSCSVIIPLYIYPLDNSSWSPVHDAIKLRPDLTFTIVINPRDGPGPGSSPDEHYSVAVTQLSNYTNVQIIGYVRTNYTNRNIIDVIKDVETYSGWSSISSSLAMQGIFFDEAPHEYSATADDFMRRVNQVVKNSAGLRGARMIIHNPGTVPDARLNGTSPDVTVVFEDDYTAWQKRKDAVAAVPLTRSARSVMINSLPAMDSGALKDFVNSVSRVAGQLFVTTIEADFYESFASGWLEFVKLVPS